jgi:hypothetical protein
MTGCASSVPKPKFSQEIAAESRIGAKDDAKVKVEAASGLKVLESDKSRLVELIGQRIDSRKSMNGGAGDKKTYEVDLMLTRYEKGSSFARFMLAGLGQIHIDGEVTLFELPERNQVGKFSISKTFAWGGIYGGSTSMEDIEQTFADGVAEGLTGKAEAK